MDVNVKSKLTPELFAIWLHHFYASVDENFKGEKAEQIKTQALSIATILRLKIMQQNLNNYEFYNYNSFLLNYS